MLLHSTIISVYLKRRSRLFQAYSTQSKQTSFSSQQSQQNSNSEFSTAEGIKKWLINFGQLLEASPFQIRQLRCLIESIPQTYIYLSKHQLINLLALSISFQPASKISNIMYYLCRKSKAFRKQLQIYLKQQAQQLCKNTNLLTSYKEKMVIILTDMFIFGIYFTQTQFINHVFYSLFQQPQLQILDQQSKQKTIFQMYYIKHYVQILTYPSVMLQRNRTKFINTIRQYLYQRCFKILSHMLDLTNVSLERLQLLYSQLANKRSKQIEQTQQLKKQQLEYLNYVHEYQNFKKLIHRTVHIIINSLRQSYQSYQQFQAIQTKIQKEYEPIFCETSEENKIIQKNQQYNKEQKDQTTYKESNSEDEFKESENSNSQKKDQKLLDSIDNKCKNYHKYIYLQPNPIYNNHSSGLQTNRNLSQPFTYLQLLPESYLSNLCNIADEESAERMSRQFLESYNKHCNRANLIKTIFKDLHDRNNIVYIVKVLYDISLIQKYQIDELIKEQLQIIKQKSKGRINKGIYGKYASIFVQLIKFKFIDPDFYLKGLLQLIKKSNVFNLQQKQVSETQSSIAQTLNRNQQQIPLTQLINLLQKCGLQIYYFSLNCHILFNQIISHIYRHIRKKVISYDIEIINRFNGIVLYLQNIKKLQNFQIKKLSIDQIINQRNFQNQVIIFQKQLKNSLGYQNVCSILVNSIQSQNYIQSYLYAELIYEINYIQLDNIIKHTTFNKIKLGLDLGNYQKATIWARFLGQLHRFKIIAQNQFLHFLRQPILRDYFQKQQCASTKIICSALEACTSYMKKTKKISQFNETLRFLLCFKKELLRVRGLQNTILQHQIQQIMQNFHIAFKWIRSVQDCNFLQYKMLQKRNIDVEKLLSNFQKDCKLRQENLKVEKQLKIEESLAKTNHYMDKQIKFMQKKLNFDKTIPYSEYKQTQLVEQLLQKIQISQLETNSSRIQKQINSNDNPSHMLKQKLQGKPKKIKIVGRSKNSKKLQKIQVTI